MSIKTATRSPVSQARWLAIVIGCVWLYQGLVPKLLMLDATEQALAAAIGVPCSWQSDFVLFSGAAEILWGCVFVLGFRHRAIVWLNSLALIMLIALVAIAAPVYLTTAFNALTFNVTMLALNLQIWWLLHHKPA